MSASTTESTASSQSTDHPTESTVSSENTDFSDPLLEKVFLAGCRKNFVGPGPRKFSKAEINELDISGVVDFVAGKVEHSQVKKSITYYLGLCRIYHQAVTFFEEDVVKLHDDLNSVLYNDDYVPSTPKKAQKPKKKKDDQENNGIDAASIHSLELVDHNYVALMERKLKTDKHLMNEMDDRLRAVDTLGDFGDESHLHNSLENYQINPLGSPPLIPDVLPDNTDAQSTLDGFEAAGGTAGISSGTVVVTQAVVHRSEGTEARPPSSSRREDRREGDGSAKRTPKRKPGSPHDETPSKRQRIKSPTDSSGGKISVSRKLFGPDAPSSPMPADEIMRQNVDQDGVGPFDERLPPPSASQEGIRRISVQIHADPTTVQDAEVDPESEQPPAAVVPPQGAQRLPEASLEDSIGTELEELPEETVAALTPKRRKRTRPLVDEKTQIPRMDILNFEKYVHVHTKTAQSARINLEKLSLKNLFSMPSTKLNANGPCTWPKKLQYLYTENAHLILQPDHERTLASLTPRDINVDKRPRLSIFRPNDRPGSTEPSIPQDENITPAGIDENITDRDRELMPPPPEPPMLSRPSDEQTTPRTADRSRVEQNKPPSVTSSPQQKSPRAPGQPDASSPQHRLPRTPGRDRQPDTSAVSPRQEQPIPLILEPEPAADAEHSAEAQLPVQMSPTPSAKERSILMDNRAFYKFLEDKWVTSFGKVELDDLIDPRRSTLTKFHRYFTYLQSFQVKKKLLMEQETIYGPVHILKTIEE